MPAYKKALRNKIAQMKFDPRGTRYEGHGQEIYPTTDDVSGHQGYKPTEFSTPEGLGFTSEDTPEDRKRIAEIRAIKALSQKEVHDRIYAEPKEKVGLDMDEGANVLKEYQDKEYGKDPIDYETGWDDSLDKPKKLKAKTKEQ